MSKKIIKAHPSCALYFSELYVKDHLAYMEFTKGYSGAALISRAMEYFFTKDKINSIFNKNSALFNITLTYND